LFLIFVFGLLDFGQLILMVFADDKLFADSVYFVRVGAFQVEGLGAEDALVQVNGLAVKRALSTVVQRTPELQRFGLSANGVCSLIFVSLLVQPDAVGMVVLVALGGRALEYTGLVIMEEPGERPSACK